MKDNSMIKLLTLSAALLLTVSASQALAQGHGGASRGRKARVAGENTHKVIKTILATAVRATSPRTAATKIAATKASTDTSRPKAMMTVAEAASMRCPIANAIGTAISIGPTA